MFLNSRPAPGTAAFAIAVISLTLWALSANPGHAQEGPFVGLSGSWSGGGSITLSSGSREHLQCRANYSVRGGGNELGLTLRCAGDSYNFAFRGDARSRDGTVTGSWSETNQGVSGRFNGRARGGHIGARVEGENFTASLDINTNGDRQSISIRSPGSEFSEVSVSLRRR
jgi:hypothetical protein